MTLFNPVFNRVTPKGIKRSKTQADEGLTPADEAGYVFLSQPQPASLRTCPGSMFGTMLSASSRGRLAVA